MIDLGKANIDPHDYGCGCKRCEDMFKAIVAQVFRGNYFFTDDELLELSVK